MNRWQKFWKGFDEARMFVRLGVVATAGGFFFYVWRVTENFFESIRMAYEQNGSAAWGNLVSVLGAETAFVSVTIPILAKMVKDIWLDYRNSGIKWEEKDDQP